LGDFTELKWGVTYILSNEEKEVSIQLRRLNKVDWSLNIWIKLHGANTQCAL